MTSKDIFEDAFPQDKQIGGSHYKDFHIQPYEFISKNDIYIYECITFKINLLFPLRVSEKSIISCAFASGVGAGRCRCWCALTVT